MFKASLRLRPLLGLTVLGSAVLAGAAFAAPSRDFEDGRYTPHFETACLDDGTACATYHCDIFADCTRVGAWEPTDRPRAYRGYHTVSGYDDQTVDRCNDQQQCATWRCDVDGDNCVRVSGWRDR